MKTRKETDFREFIYLLAGLTPVEQCGVAKILRVPFAKDGSHREFSEVYSDMLDTFLSLNKKQRRNLLSILREAKQDGDQSEITE